MDLIGIIIRVNAYRDFDTMVTMLTENGLFSFLARGVKKFNSKNAYLINTFNKVNLTLMKGKDGYFLKNGKLLDSFAETKDDIESLSALDFISELTNLFILNEAKYIYEYLEKSLEMLNKKIEPKMICVLYFAKVLKYSGYSVEVNSCQKCHKTHDIVAFSIVDGGFICRECFDGLNHIKMNPTQLKQIRYIFMVDVDNFSKVIFSKEDCLELIRLLDRFVKNNIQIDLKSINLIENF